MEVFSALSGYYESHDEDARFASNHGCVEFRTTVRYVERYLQDGMRILEIGAGTGRYSHYFAQQGYEVDAVELMPCNVERFRANTRPGERVRIAEGNAMDLSFLKSGSYDVTLLLGPLYHLFTTEDKLRALREAVRVTKRGGIVFAAYCCADPAIVQGGFARGMVRQLIDGGLLNEETFQAHSDPKDVFELHRKEDIDALMSGFDVQRLHYVGTDMFAHYMRGLLDQMDDETFELYMRYHFSICERPDMVGISNHVLDVFRKNE